MKKSLQLVGLLFAFFLSTICHAGCKIDVSKFVGWSIIHSGTVTGYIDENGEESDSFEGCEYGRRLIIDYRYQVTCTTYAYHYAYHPDIVILSKGSSKVACIDGDTFDIE